MRDGWKSVKLGEIADIQTGPFGSQLHEKDYVLHDGVPIVTVEHLGARKFTTQNLPLVSHKDADRLSRYAMCCGDIIFSRVGSVDRCSLVTVESDGWLFSGRCLRVRTECDVVDSAYLYYWFCFESTKRFVRSIAVGATMPSINTRLLSEVPISLPPVETQKKIAGVLGALDDKIELNRKMNENLEAQAQALFKSWFVDFTPFGGKMPDSWRKGKLGEIAEIVMGNSPKGETLNTDGNGEIFYQGKTEFGWRFPSVRLYTTDPKRMAKVGDVLVSVRAPVGALNIANNPCCVGRGVAAVSSKYQSFLYYALQHAKPQFNVYDGEGTVFGCIDKAGMYGINLMIPTEGSLIEFESIVGPLDSMIANNERESRKLAEVRDALLPKLMRGEVEV